MSDLLLMASSPLRSILSTPGLVACYLPWLQIARGATGQTLLDYSGRGNHAQLGSTTGEDTNDPSWGSNALVFDGTDDYCLKTFANTSSLAFSRDFTLILAYTWGGTSSVGVCLGSGNSTNKSELFLSNITGVRVETVINTTMFRCRTNVLPLSDGLWNLTFANRSGNTFNVYHNGSFLTPDYLDTQTDASFTWPVENNFVLGHRDYASGLSLPLNGSIAFGGVVNRALSNAEMVQAYNNLQTLLAGQGVTLA